MLYNNKGKDVKKMNEKLVVSNLKKTFTLSKKQQMIEKSNDKYKVAVNDLSFKA